MNETLSLGRIAGVRVGLHWSVLVIVALVAVALARGRFPDAHPGHSDIAYWALALLTAVVFLGSLLTHELAHAVVARRNGVQLDGITLWMLGDAARLHDEAPTPAAELRIAGVGPLTSLLAGGVLAGVAAGLDALHASGLVVEAFRLAGRNQRSAGCLQRAARRAVGRGTAAARVLVAPHRRPSAGHSTCLVGGPGAGLVHGGDRIRGRAVRA
jgi:Zn-dependent protease